MNMKSKVRTVRKLAEKMMTSDNQAFDDIDMMYAPRECYGVVIESSRKEMQAIFSAIGISLRDWCLVMNEWITKEAGSIPGLSPDPPPAFYTFFYVADLLDPCGS